MFYIYLFIWSNPLTGEKVFEVTAEKEKQTNWRTQLLFEIPEHWLPIDQPELLRAAKHFGIQLPEQTIWIGYVPF